jgi:CubicO group peptidase (beta-lactamase class C family)
LTAKQVARPLSLFGGWNMNFETSLDALFAPWDVLGMPGGVAAVVRDGETIYAKGFGLADLVNTAPFTPRSVFHICSVTKQFTALCILMLEARGMLQLNDPVHRYLPSLPDFGASITIGQLTTNISGLRDYMALPFLADGLRFKSLSKQDTVRLILNQRSLQSTPGARYGYSNTNFVLLGWIIEALTNRPLGEIFHEWIFAPLGMSDTRLLTQSAPGPEGGVVGYYPDGNGLFVAPRLDVYEAGDGGIWSSLNDLILWERNFVECRIGSPELFDRLATPARLVDGTPSWYAHGLGTGTHGGAFWQGHSGGLSGMSVNRLYFPEHKLSVVAASNGPGLDVEGLTFRIADRFLPPEATPHAITPVVVDVADDWAGVYQSEDRGRTAVLTRSGDTPVLEWLSQPYVLSRRDGVMLCDESGMCALTVEGKGGQRRMQLRLGRGGAIALAVRTYGPAVSAAHFCGTYRSTELESCYAIEEADGDLSVTIRGPRSASVTFALRRVADDVFYPLHKGQPLGAVITFPAAGTLSISASKAENILFQRTSA